MEPRRRPAAAAGLHQLPDFAEDDAEQHQNGGAIHQDEGHRDVARRLDPGQAGQDDEGEEGGQQRQANGDRRQQPHQGAPLRLSKGRVELGGRGVYAGHSGKGVRWGSSARA